VTLNTTKKILILLLSILNATAFGQAEQIQNPTDFLLKGFVVFEKITGDLNNDGMEDCVLIIKGTDKNQIIFDSAEIVNIQTTIKKHNLNNLMFVHLDVQRR
jgi:hypothetical protein